MHTYMRICGLGRCIAAAALMTICATSREAAAQGPCEEQWLPGEGVPGVFGSVYAMTWWDPDGYGPVRPRVVVGGSFTLAGDVIANSIAAWDPETGEWFAFGQGLGNHVLSLAVTNEGELIAGGRFTQTANRVARWDVAAGEWVPMGGGVGYDVYALALLPNGEVVAGGQFNAPLPQAGQSVMRWNGTAWVSMNFDQFYANSVRAMLVLPDGDLLVGGYITNVTGAPSARSVARWNGSVWSAVGTGMGIGSILDLERLSDGTVLAVGDFDTADGLPANNIARWNGTAWEPVGGGIQGSISAAQQLPNGEIVVAGGFSSHNNIARWNGSQWLPLGSGVDPKSGVSDFLILSSGELLVGGGFSFTQAGGVPVRSMAKWNSATEQWSNLGPGMNNRVSAVLIMPNGDMIVGGRFRTAGEFEVGSIVRRDRATGQWHPMGSGMDAAVSTLRLMPNGDVLATGVFTTAGGMPAAGLARWNGNAWSSLGAPPPGTGVMAIMPDGGLVMGRNEFLSSGELFLWDGSGQSTPIGVFDGDVSTVHVMPNGDLIAGGTFRNVNGVSMLRVARRSSETGQWSPLGAGIDDTSVGVITSLPNGDIILAGGIDRVGGITVNHITRWNGETWTALGSGVNHYVEDLTVLPNGDLIVVGRFTRAGTITVNHVARWNGASWFALGQGVNASVTSVASGLDGEIAVTGDITEASGHISAFIARWGVPEDCCRADFDQNGVREVSDIFAFLSAWFDQDSRADFDGIGGVAAPDIFAFLSAWFAGC